MRRERVSLPSKLFVHEDHVEPKFTPITCNPLSSIFCSMLQPMHQPMLQGCASRNTALENVKQQVPSSCTSSPPFLLKCACFMIDVFRRAQFKVHIRHSHPNTRGQFLELKEYCRKLERKNDEFLQQVLFSYRHSHTAATTRTAFERDVLIIICFPPLCLIFLIPFISLSRLPLILQTLLLFSPLNCFTHLLSAAAHNLTNAFLTFSSSHQELRNSALSSRFSSGIQVFDFT